MAQAQSGEDREGIKLFGTRITLHGRVKSKDEKQSEDGNEEKRPNKIIACPRCKSMETKFCYFNNYNVNQPRHFCKGCLRYWTAGGALRNVPIGAGRRKVKPPCHGTIGFPDADFYEASTVQQFGFDELHDFHRLLSSKRKKTSSDNSQPC